MAAADLHRPLTELLAALPLNAEEGGLREVVAEAELASRIKRSTAGGGTAQVVVAMMRRLYNALDLLDSNELAQDRWAFVSFPASLIARSVLATLATNGQTFFEAGYWVQGGHRPDDLIEQQRELLRYLESQRVHSHPESAAPPIRTVHVAWGIIRLGGDFLLRMREDRQRPEVKGHVFTGGRLDSTDLPPSMRSTVGLRDLFQVSSKLALEALPNTLARELREELGLLRSEYQASYLRNLAPFKMLEGTRNNHAYTQYNVVIFAIQLTREGELKVLDCASREGNQWAWFTAAELAAGKRADGKSAFVTALSAELGQKTEQFLLEQVSDSSTAPPTYCAEGDSLELPAKPLNAVLKGMTGRERGFSFAPDGREWELLMILGWRSRGLEILVRGEAITPLGAGWVRVNDDALLRTAQGLARRLKEMGFPFVEIDSFGHCRLSLDPHQVYFHPNCFQYSWQLESPKKSIALTLKEIDTTWARLARSVLEIPLAPQFAKDLVLIEQGKAPAGDIERESRRLFEPARNIGLRKFISVTKRAYEVVVPPEVP